MQPKDGKGLFRCRRLGSFTARLRENIESFFRVARIVTSSHRRNRRRVSHPSPGPEHASPTRSYLNHHHDSARQVQDPPALSKPDSVPPSPSPNAAYHRRLSLLFKPATTSDSQAQVDEGHVSVPCAQVRPISIITSSASMSAALASPSRWRPARNQPRARPQSEGLLVP